MRNVLIGALLGASLAIAPAMAQEKVSAKEFVEKAGQEGMAEVQLGKMASDKAQNAQVKSFAQRMVDDHTKANDELKKIADAKKLTMPTEAGAEAKQTMDKLSKTSGEEFDRAYMRKMVEDHKKDVELFQKFAQGGDDPELKTFAENTVPTLQEHLKLAQDLAGGEKAETPASGSPSGTTR